MKKIIFLPMLLLVFSLTACGAKKEEVSLAALEKNEALIATAAPCSTVYEVRKAKIPLGNAPFDSQSNEENGQESVTYLVQDEKFSLSLAGYEMKNSLFQFINGKLSNITINLTDSGSYEAVKTEMTRLYGEPATENSAEGIEMNVWEFQADYPVRAAVIGYGTDGQSVSGSVQVSYIWFGTED